MKHQVVAAVDIGTSSAKAAIVDRAGRMLGTFAVDYPLHTPTPARAEQDPDQICEAVVAAVGRAMENSGVSAGDVLCVSFSSAMHSLIAVAADMRPLTPCITWADNRSAEYICTLYEQYDGKQIYMATGTPIHPMSPLLKIMWLRDHEPDIFRQTDKFIGIKEYVFAKMCGRLVVDYSVASATGLFNLRKLAWDPQALAAAGITADKLSEPVPPDAALRGLKPGIAARMGLQPDTPLVAGASDGVLANLGIGATDQETFVVTIGTSGAVRMTVDRPLTDPKERLFCYALSSDRWVIGGPINNGGVLFRWVRDQLATLEAEHARAQGIDPYEALAELAAEIKPGSDGLLVVPYFSGERAPYWNANARGVFFGLSLYHRKPHMIRAVMEGICYAIESVARALAEMAGPAKRILASGGFARSALWCQMMADVLGVPLHVPQAHDSSAIGAAIVGFDAIEGSGRQVLDALAAADDERVYLPDPANHQLYQRFVALHEKVYLQLTEAFDEIAELQETAPKSAASTKPAD